VRETTNLIIRTWSEEAWNFVRDRSVTTEIAAGEILCRDGQPFTHFIFPHSSILTVQSSIEGMRPVEMMAIGREGFVGLPMLGYGSSSEGDVIGLISGSATYVPRLILREAFHQFLCIRMSMMRYGRFSTQTLMQSVVCAKSHHVDRVIAFWLLKAVERLQSPDVPITHEILSNLFGLRRATVTTTLSKFAQEGILETSRGVIHILSRERLEAYSGEFYAKWRRDFAELKEALPVEAPPIIL